MLIFCYLLKLSVSGRFNALKTPKISTFPIHRFITMFNKSIPVISFTQLGLMHLLIHTPEPQPFWKLTHAIAC